MLPVLGRRGSQGRPINRDNSTTVHDRQHNWRGSRNTPPDRILELRAPKQNQIRRIPFQDQTAIRGNCDFKLQFGGHLRANSGRWVNERAESKKKREGEAFLRSGLGLGFRQEGIGPRRGAIVESARRSNIYVWKLGVGTAEREQIPSPGLVASLYLRARHPNRFRCHGLSSAFGVSFWRHWRSARAVR